MSTKTTRQSFASPSTRTLRSQPSSITVKSPSVRRRHSKLVPLPPPVLQRATTILPKPRPEPSPSPDPLAFDPLPQALPSSSTLSIPPVHPSSHVSRKGKGRAVEPEKRVLPARIRRAAGGGADGIRDLEEMIVDWLERWGAPCTSPPDDLVLDFTTLPLDLVYPPTFRTEVAQPAPPPITITPTRVQHYPLPSPSPRALVAPVENKERIETPSWVLVKPGEDDKEEAREELELTGRGSSMSPVKRLRKDGPTEDTSDNYYISLHKRYEVFERRQRLREREKLVFERYKMKSRIDLLRNMSTHAWAAVVAAVLSRGEEWTAGRAKVGLAGADWLRSKLVKEGMEVMRRYDQLLPVEKKQKRAESMTPTLTPSRASGSADVEEDEEELGPPIVNARIAALKDPVSRSSRSASTPTAAYRSQPYDERVSTSTRRKRKLETLEPPDQVDSPNRPARRRNSATKQAGKAVKHDIVPVDLTHSSAATDRRTRHHSPFFPPLTGSRQAVLVEAASRRESASAETDASREKVITPGSNRTSSRDKTRTSSRLGLVAPFGMPLPPVVEFKSEFTLSDEEDFWPIIADREARANQIRRTSLILASSPAMIQVSKEEAAEIERVEAAVVL